VLLRPFPWSTLAREDRHARRALSALRQALTPPAPPGAALEALGRLLRATGSVSVDGLSTGPVSPSPGGSVKLHLSAPTDASDRPGWWVVVEADAPLVAAVVARAMGGNAPRVTALREVSPALVGAFAAVAAAALRQAGVVAGVAPVAVAAGVEAESLVARLTVTLGDEVFPVRAVLPASLLGSCAPAFGRADLQSLGDLPLSLPVVACQTYASVGEVAALAPGDAWMLGESWKLGASASKVAGRVWLCAGSAELGVVADLEVSGRIVVRSDGEELGWSAMQDSAAEQDGLVQAVGEVPVVVRVEIGAVSMRAKEWSLLRPGDVVAMGSPVGAAVTLRVGGAAVAEGELVDLDGEIGVRIARRLGGASS
jgi:flagellar motor switch/type III secretory pathway protein FliN